MSLRARLGLALAIAVLGATARGAATPPWPRTETREPCTRSEPLRTPFFGDLHVHTRFSADAYIYGTRAEPHDAYAFAKGAAIAISDTSEQPTRTARLDRPLDFAAVTDHSEFFGESLLCATPGSAPYDFDICKIFRSAETPQTQFTTIIDWLYPAGIDNPPPSLPFCNEPGVDCDGAAVTVWHTIQAAAEEAYDRTAGCAFTSFVGYEHTPSPLGRHLHRNIIFRNAQVPPFAYSQLETAADGVPQGIWNAIERNCLNAGTGCDAVIIPHNSNLSEGRQWEDPSGPEEALRRQLLEPLAEIHQVKGNSECRFDRLARMGIGTDDELCDFEQLAVAHEGPDNMPPPAIAAYPRRSMIRNTLKDGLGFEQRWGVNPWKLGFVGDTDTHDAAPGNTGEESWTGAHGANDASPARLISDEIHDNPGGLTAVWAEENSRDAIFEALRRRETYATSGTRPVVRFFAGELDGVRCGRPDLVERAYTTGTPMGGDVGASGGRRGPRFVVWAAKDPGTADRPGTDLQRIQIVKGWVDSAGTTHESVFDVAGDPANGADVDHDTCAPTGSGARELCTGWRDPHFDPQVPAFYYARILENPTCRWSTRTCKAAGVDPFSTDCAAQAAAAGPRFRELLPRTRKRPVRRADDPGTRMVVTGLVPSGGDRACARPRDVRDARRRRHPVAAHLGRSRERDRSADSRPLRAHRGRRHDLRRDDSGRHAHAPRPQAALLHGSRRGSARRASRVVLLARERPGTAAHRYPAPRPLAGGSRGSHGWRDAGERDLPRGPRPALDPARPRARRRVIAMRWMERPMLHFLLIGGMLFAVSRWMPSTRTPVVVSGADVARRGSEWAWQHGEQPDAETRRVIEDEAVDDAVLYRSAVDTGVDVSDTRLHERLLGFPRADTVERRHVTQLMRLAAERLGPGDLPSEAELAAYLAAHAGTFAEPSTLSLTQVYFAADRHGPSLARDAQAAAEAVRREKVSPADAARPRRRVRRGVDCARDVAGSARGGLRPRVRRRRLGRPGRHVDRTGPVDLRAAPGVDCRAYPGTPPVTRCGALARPPVDAVRAPRRAASGARGSAAGTLRGARGRSRPH